MKKHHRFESAFFNLFASIAPLVSGALAYSILSGVLMAVLYSHSNASPQHTTNKNSKMPRKRDAEAGCWNVVPSPNANEIENELYAVTGGGNDVWAVGIYDLFGLGDYRTMTMHWDSSAWSLMPSPNPGTAHDYIFGATSSGSDVWAVGMFNNTCGQPDRTLTLHWNGSAWSQVASPNAGTSTNLLWGATGSGSDVWAAGESSNGQFIPSQTLTLHWNGSAWSVVP